jgi:hypothetical protein
MSLQWAVCAPLKPALSLVTAEECERVPSFHSIMISNWADPYLIISILQSVSSSSPTKTFDAQINVSNLATATITL